jgi:hypothetical protein
MLIKLLQIFFIGYISYLLIRDITLKSRNKLLALF